MKSFAKYLIYHKKMIIMYIVFAGIFCISFALYHIPVMAVVYPAFLCLFVLLIVAGIDYAKVFGIHKELETVTHSIPDDLPDRIPEGTDHYNDYRNIIERLCSENAKLHTEMTAKYDDLVDYYTVWAHQIKIPISSMYLTLQNEDTELSRKLLSGLRRIERYVEMVLTYLKLDSDTTDYVIKEYEIDSIVKQSVRKMSGEFIYRKISMDMKESGIKVITDEKWLGFVLEQILSNALKYTKEGIIKIYVNTDNKLCIEDSGIGIAPEDLPRVFDRGYTGYNGRSERKASGIGLYVCKRICKNLGHSLEIESEVDKGTLVMIGLGREEFEFD